MNNIDLTAFGMNEQTATAIRVLSDFWGVPDWLTKPKEGQNPEAIIAQWNAFLRLYSVGTVESACIKIFNEKRSRTFPTISHLKAALAGETRDNEPKQRGRIADDTVQRLTATYVKNGCRGRLCFASDISKAFATMINDMIAELPREATAGKTFSDLQQLAKNNGYIARFEDYLAEITKNRRPYQPINDELRVIDVPEAFSPNNERRKCA